MRPFISSLAFPYANLIHSFLLLIFLLSWFIYPVRNKSPKATDASLVKISNGVYKGIAIKKIPSLKQPLVMFCLALIISVIFSIDKLNSLKELYKYISGILIFLFAFSLNYKQKIWIIKVMVFGGFLISLLAIHQYFFGFPHLLDYLAKDTTLSLPFFDYPNVLESIKQRRVFFPFVTPNTLGGYLAMIIPLALTNKDRIWFIIPLSFALLLTKSLGAFLSVFLALAIYFYLQGKLEKRGILFLFGLLIIMGLIFITRSAIQRQHIQPFFLV